MLPYSWCPKAQHVAQMSPEFPLGTMHATLRNANNVLTVRTDCHMLGAKTSPEKPSPNLFPNISGFTVVLLLLVVVVVVILSPLLRGLADAGAEGVRRGEEDN